MTLETTPQSTGIPRIGDKAPDFTAVTTHGELTLSDWQGDDWLILFSHPADFTPVCSTELSEFARRQDEFTQRKTKLIGLSIDSVHSHLAWVENLKKILGTEIPFPIIADLDTKVANLYGMIHPGESSTVTVRAVFLIDPKRVVRALIYYPLNVGRNIDEIVRLLDALRMTDAKGVAAPVNWKEGDMVIIPPPKSVAEVAKLKERVKQPGYESLDFYLNKTSV